MMERYQIRLETPSDYRAVEELTRDAFWNHHTPGCDEHYLAHLLRNADCFLPELDFIAEQNGAVFGNIMYTRALVRGDDGVDYPVLSFGPLSVSPERQGRGIGASLIHRSLAAAWELGHAAVLIYGDPDYYSRVGFVPAESFGIGTSYDEYAAALLAIELVPGALRRKAGRFFEDEAYQVDPEAAAAFDETFPYKERVTGLPSQIRFLQHLTMRKPRK